MSGNLWMFSDLLDDEDIEMLQHDFITYRAGFVVAQILPDIF